MMVDCLGNVGFGTITPATGVNAVYNSTGKNVITIQNTSTTGYSSMDFINSSGTLASTFGFANSGTGGIFTSRAYMNSYGNDFILTNNSTTPALFIQGSTGNVGIGNSIPSYDLDVTGTGRFTGKLTIGAYTLPNTDGTANQVLTTNGAGAVSWAAAPGATVGTSYSLTAVNNDPNATFGGTYAEVGEVAVTVGSGDVLLTHAFFSAQSSSTYLAIMITRSTTSGSGSVGTVVAYSGENQSGGTKFASLPVSTRETGVTAGTWYYKLWATSYASSTQSYQMVITKTQ